MNSETTFGERIFTLKRVCSAKISRVAAVTLAISYIAVARAAHFVIDAPITATQGIPSSQVPERRFDPSGQAQDVERWLVIGPFDQAADSANGLWTNYLVRAGMSLSELSSIPTTDSVGNIVPGRKGPGQDTVRVVVAGGPTNQIYLNEALGVSDLPTPGTVRVAYASCLIVASLECDTALFVRSDARIRLTLNGNNVLINDVQGDEYAEKYRTVLLVHLKKGLNRLTAHLVYNTSACGLWVSLDPNIKEAFQKVADAPDQTLADKWCLKGNEHARIAVPVGGVDGLKVNLLWRGTPISNSINSGRLELPAGWASSGVGYLKTTIQGVVLSQPIFLGNPAEAVGRYEREFQEIQSMQGAEHLKAALFRCQHLVEAEHLTPSDIVWQRNFATQAAIFEAAASAIHAGANPYRNRPGKYFRAYRSAIDGSMQYCLVYVPKCAVRTGSKLPVVLLTPAVLQNVRPFLSSVYAADGGDWATFRMAEQFRCIAVLPDGRCNAYGNPIGLADMREAVQSLAPDLPVDLRRINVQGWCSGGMYALMLWTFYPDDYNGIAVNFARTIRDKNMYPSDSERLPHIGGKEWLEANNPFALAANLSSNVVLMVHHDLEEKPYDNPGFANQTPLFAAAMGKAALPVQVLCFRRPGYYRTDEMEYMFKSGLADGYNASRRSGFFATSQTKYGRGNGIKIEEQEHPMTMSNVSVRRTGPTRLEITTSNVRQLAVDLRVYGFRDYEMPAFLVDQRNIAAMSLGEGWVRIRKSPAPLNPSGKSEGYEGPLSHMFARPFIVSLDDGQSDHAQNARRWCESFRKRWEADFFCPCRFKMLSEITKDDWQRFDVLLFSSSAENSLPGIEMAERLKITPEGIEVAGRPILGNALGIIAIWRNPTHLDHYIAIASSNNFAHCDFPDVNFAFEGWFDHLVWENSESKTPRVREVGEFNVSWH